MMRLSPLLLSAALLSSCANAADDASPPPQDAFMGTWIGVEGLYLTVDPNPVRGPDSYRLTMQYGTDAADTATVIATLEDKALRFQRDGRDLALRRGTGDETGLKWLADKRDCLVVEPGEGYCRD